MKKTLSAFLVIIMAACMLSIISCTKDRIAPPAVDFASVAPAPPMGWNSWNCFGSDVNESQVKANADYIAEHLKSHGWEYIVVDLGWYLPESVTVLTFKKPKPSQMMDDFGRLLPSPDKFPSSANGAGFKLLADYIHQKGLKFGIHIMRGIPWQAVERNTLILGTDFHARDAAAMQDTCVWYDGMTGVDMSRPAGQAYYNSILKLYAQWGVDYIKADDMSQPYHGSDIEGLHQAILTCDRPIVLSLSPGASPLEQEEHLKANANMWRISPDFWDMWQFLKHQFELCRAWAPFSEPGHWPDADMLPLGKLRVTGPDDYVANNWAKHRKRSPMNTRALMTMRKSL